MVKALIEEGELDGTGAVGGANIVEIRRFLNVKLKDRFREEIVPQEGSPLLEG